MKLIVDPRSSASLRVLTYVAYKGIAVDVVGIDILAGEHRRDDYAALNPSRAVPALDLGDDGVITQSMAIMEWLEAKHPQPAAMPADELDRARVRSLCGLIGADVHPLTNLRVRQEVERMAGEAASRQWVRHWTDVGLAAVDKWLGRYAGAYSVGDAVTLADFFVTPLVFNARRVGCDVRGYGNVGRVVGNCLKLPAFVDLTRLLPPWDGVAAKL